MSAYTYPNSQAIYYQQYEAARRDEVVGVLLALFLGSFGLHHFYLRRTGLGILYACFFWTGIPGIIGFFECFFMPGRVREYNAMQAAAIAASLGIPVPAWGNPANVMANVPPPVPPIVVPQPDQMTTCPQCQLANVAGSRFCAGCGGAL
jgi:TM2 domain-containing membrane protein YozV